MNDRSDDSGANLPSCHALEEGTRLGRLVSSWPRGVDAMLQSNHGANRAADVRFLFADQNGAGMSAKSRSRDQAGWGAKRANQGQAFVIVGSRL